MAVMTLLSMVGCIRDRISDHARELRVTIESSEPAQSATYVVRQSGDTAHFVISFGEGAERRGSIPADIRSAFADFQDAVKLAADDRSRTSDEDRQAIVVELVLAGDRRTAQYIGTSSDANKLLANAGRWTQLHGEVTRQTGRGYFWYIGPQQRLTPPPTFREAPK